MEHIDCLGLYIYQERAVGVLLSPHGGTYKLAGEFVLPTPADTDEPPLPLAERISRALAEKNLRFEQLCVALDAAEYTHQVVHSEFSEVRQIAQTIRFDTEEAIATDISEMAIAFTVTELGERGSDVSVFTTSRSRISVTLNDLQSRKLDPAIMEPDIACLGRYLEEMFGIDDETQTLYVVLGEHACYMLNASGTKTSPRVRSFLIRPDQDINAVLRKQIPMTLAAMNTPGGVTKIVLAGETDKVNRTALKEQILMEIDTLDLDKSKSLEREAGAQGIRSFERAIACGAALAEITLRRRTDFRRDFAPFLGKRKIMQKLGVVISASITIALIAVAAFYQFKAFKEKSYVRRLEEKMRTQYKQIMMGQVYRTTYGRMDQRLGNEVRKLENIHKGLLGDDSSVTAQLTYVLETINRLPTALDLEVEEISLSPQRMSLRGTTASRNQTLDFFKEIDKHPNLKRSNEFLKEAGSRDSFSVNIDMARETR